MHTVPEWLQTAFAEWITGRLMSMGGGTTDPESWAVTSSHTTERSSEPIHVVRTSTERPIVG